MLYYDRIGVSEGIDINKTRELKKCDTCPYWYFLDKWLKLQLDVCNVCLDILIMSMSLSHIAILNIHDAHYCCIISEIRKTETINVMQNIDLAENSGTL